MNRIHITYIRRTNDSRYRLWMNFHVVDLSPNVRIHVVHRSCNLCSRIRLQAPRWTFLPLTTHRAVRGGSLSSLPQHLTNFNSPFITNHLWTTRCGHDPLGDSDPLVNELKSADKQNRLTIVYWRWIQPKFTFFRDLLHIPAHRISKIGPLLFFDNFCKFRPILSFLLVNLFF